VLPVRVVILVQREMVELAEDRVAVLLIQVLRVRRAEPAVTAQPEVRARMDKSTSTTESREASNGQFQK
jgi:hypothetical protein